KKSAPRAPVSGRGRGDITRPPPLRDALIDHLLEGQELEHESALSGQTFEAPPGCFLPADRPRAVLFAATMRLRPSTSPCIVNSASTDAVDDLARFGDRIERPSWII